MPEIPAHILSDKVLGSGEIRKMGWERATAQVEQFLVARTIPRHHLNFVAQK